MNQEILIYKLNEALNTMDLRMPKAIKMLKRVDNLRNKLIKSNDYLIEYALIEQCYKIAVEFNNKAMSELYNEMIGKSEFSKKSSNYAIDDNIIYLLGTVAIVVTMFFVSFVCMY